MIVVLLNALCRNMCMPVPFSSFFSKGCQLLLGQTHKASFQYPISWLYAETATFPILHTLTTPVGCQSASFVYSTHRRQWSQCDIITASHRCHKKLCNISPLFCFLLLEPRFFSQPAHPRHLFRVFSPSVCSGVPEQYLNTRFHIVLDSTLARR